MHTHVYLPMNGALRLGACCTGGE